MECIRHDQDDAIQFFNCTFLDSAVDHVPLLTKRAAWVTPVIHDNIIHGDRLLKKAGKLDTPEEHRNITFRSIRRAKTTFFHDSLENSRNSWKTLKNSMGSTEKPSIAAINKSRTSCHSQPGQDRQRLQQVLCLCCFEISIVK